MHSTQQLGYHHPGLGVFVYHDGQPQGAQMGNLFDDAWGAITGSVQSASQKAYKELQAKIVNYPQDLKDKMMAEFLDSPTGQAFEAEAKKGWINTQVDKIRTVYLENKSMVQNIALGGAALVAALVLWKAFSAGKSSGARQVVRYQTVSPEQALAGKTNPKRRRSKRKSRKVRRRRK